MRNLTSSSWPRSSELNLYSLKSISMFEFRERVREAMLCFDLLFFFFFWIVFLFLQSGFSFLRVGAR